MFKQWRRATDVDMTMPRRRYFVTVAAATGVLLLAAVPARAETTIGSDLAVAPGVALNCGGCTVSQRSLPGHQVTAPADGVIVRWRIRVGAFSTTQPVKLRVIRGSGAASVAVGSSQNEQLQAMGIHTFDTRLPISTGDFIGIDCCAAWGNYFRTLTGASRDVWAAPSLLDGEMRAPDGPSAVETMINADIEPDADGDGFGDETQDGCLAHSGQQGGCGTHALDTAITHEPKRKTHKRAATFKFNSGTPASSFECSLDGAPFAPCASPEAYKVRKGKHIFEVRAVDSAGNVDPTPATSSWRFKKRSR